MKKPVLLYLLIIGLLLNACNLSIPIESLKFEKQAETFTPALREEKHINAEILLSEEIKSLIELELPACINSNAKKDVAFVERVIDGDSIIVKIRGEEFEVRYIGINTPECGGSMKAAAEEATKLNRDLVEGQYVLLVKDVSETDKYNRLLRYVFTINSFVNYELVNKSVAAVVSYPPDIACHHFFVTAQQETK